ncbi:TM2 domain-containing protein almondex-like [Atheta coriaria]|uniref:TM2 domain-containing protein almondex-like n=2 Tax=Dalotia coriaria TaxID=877792 RepID=UPI0031F460EB
MQCYQISAKKACLILLMFVVNGAQHSQFGDNNMDLSRKSQNFKEVSLKNNPEIMLSHGYCSAHHENCEQVSGFCLSCDMNSTCIYGQKLNATCNVPNGIICMTGKKTFEKEYICRYCYQTEPWEHTCDWKASCNSVAINRSQYTTNCTVNDNIICLGSRTFNKNVYCNWTGGYRWSTALVLSITLGGFGADRFYLGHWQEGIGKLFSFGGLGVWTLIDVILISLHYLGPADGSLYI